MNHSLLQSVHSPALDRMAEAAAKGQTVAVCGLQEAQAAFVASQLAENTGLRVMLVTANDLRAVHASDDCAQLLGSGAACLPGGEIDLTRGTSSQESSWRRLETLCGIMNGDVRLLTVSMDALVQRMGSPKEFRDASITLAPGTRIRPETMISRLMRMGYERVELVEGKGQCALRGSILDVFSPADAQGVRIEFFDDEVDSIRALDCMSQRSLNRLEETRITPAAEVLLPADDASNAATRMRRALQSVTRSIAAEPLLFEDLPPLPEDDAEDEAYYEKEIAPKARNRAASATREAEIGHRLAALSGDADLVESGMPFRRIRAWLPVLTENTYTMLDWYDPQIIFLVEPDHLRDRAKERVLGFNEELQSAIERGEAVREQEGLIMDWEELLRRMEGRPLIAGCDLLRSLGGVRPQVTLNLNSRAITGYASQIRTLGQDIRTWLDSDMTVVLLAGGVSRGKRLQDTLRELEIHTLLNEADQQTKDGGVTILPITLSHGFVWEEGKLAVVTDSDIWGSSYRKARSKANAGEKISSFTELKPGDYVVHEHHGVGVFQGTVHMQNDGAYHDYLMITYAGTDKLYVPVEQLSAIQRYIGNPNQPPKLNRIGGGDWEKQKAKVKEGLKKLAFDLVELYARRSNQTGYAFAPDTPWQREFEDQFPYELTEDQAQSVHEIKEDMESGRNMDRLLCGDVGYGKTEVSLRAAFKAVMDNKQVAILAPTTILAQQHYNTCLKRFAGFPVRVEVLSRFRTAKEVKQLLADLHDGKIDILVGTHRLLAKDVKFARLGLLIVDEEQRFGVGHKEIIKNMKSQMDVLTLSATPIPRTLHMSMVGIRDLSTLAAPPEDRIPVQTHVTEYSDALVRDAILRELSRGGQVYFLYNRVHTIEKFYQRLRALVPEARIGVAHGQMREHGLEDMMMDFYSGSYDVLLCTTIIESGLDVPTANTLIVYDAERFGLSQLYQLRGRVGRSNRQAYAYFTVRSDHLLSETAQQRLNAIREFTEFGSGFRIAMRDLEIRGAGNLLGPEQHGHLETVGYEMYCRLIEQTLNEARGKAVLPDLQTRVDLRVDAFLPDTFIHSEGQRMEMYRRIADLRSDADREDIIDELADRFGDIPPAVDTLLDVSQLRYLCSTVGISHVQRKNGQLVMRLDEHYISEPMLLVKAMQQTSVRLALAPTGPSAMLLRDVQGTDRQVMKEALKLMRTLSESYTAMVEAAAAKKAEKEAAD